LAEQGATASRLFISGRVQGVGFRWFTLRQAERLGIVGWSRNLPDGRVEVVAKGPAEAVADLEVALHQGPRLARVDNVDKVVIPHDTITCNTFEIR
jgi:acylphosphatase